MLPFEFSYAFDSSKEEVCREIAASSATCCVSANEAAASFEDFCARWSPSITASLSAHNNKKEEENQN